ncbi:duf74 family protein [Cystoisospora suis]|uniref:Duf74 family protein n=1 Tax=Cystoisospora suis TaxID=483139 RepID=A0A2C6LDK1_9APIC|nr:duf74 family protein [Cystoisospora suis]
MATSRITSLVSVPSFSLRSRSDSFVGAKRAGSSSSCFGGVGGGRKRARSPGEENPRLISALQTLSVLHRPVRCESAGGHTVRVECEHCNDRRPVSTSCSQFLATEATYRKGLPEPAAVKAGDQGNPRFLSTLTQRSLLASLPVPFPGPKSAPCVHIRASPLTSSVSQTPGCTYPRPRVPFGAAYTSVSPLFASIPCPAGWPRDFPLLPALQTFSSYSLFTKEPHVKPASDQQRVSPNSRNSNHTDSGTSCGIWASNLGQEATFVDGKEILVSATPSIPGFSTLAYKGFVQGCSVRSRDLLRMAKVILMVQFGGEMDDLTSLIRRVKDEAINRLCQDAVARGANAVVGVRLVSSGTHQRTAVEFSAYGTAVVVKSLAS